MMNNVSNKDPFWSENIKLTVEEIENKFPEKIANTLKIEKALSDK